MGVWVLPWRFWFGRMGRDQCKRHSLFWWGCSSKHTLKNPDLGNWFWNPLSQEHTDNWGQGLSCFELSRLSFSLCITQISQQIYISDAHIPIWFPSSIKYLLFVIIFYISLTELQISLGLRLYFIHFVFTHLCLAQCLATNKSLINVCGMKGLQKQLGVVLNQQLA